MPVAVPAIAAGTAFVVEVAEADLYTDGNGMCGSFMKEFRLGANASSESHGSYYKSGCAGGAAVNTPTIWTNNDALIAVEGAQN